MPATVINLEAAYLDQPYLLFDFGGLARPRHVLEPLIIRVLNLTQLVLQCLILVVQLLDGVNNLSEFHGQSLLTSGDRVEVRDMIVLAGVDAQLVLPDRCEVDGHLVSHLREDLPHI